MDKPQYFVRSFIWLVVHRAKEVTTARPIPIAPAAMFAQGLTIPATKQQIEQISGYSR